jgi:tyrosyl-tRNA synthetase
MTIMVHSEEDLTFAQQASEMLFSPTSVDVLRSFNEQQLLEVMDGVNQVNGSRQALTHGLDLITFLAESGVFASKGEAKKMLQNGGVSVNKEKVAALDFALSPGHLLNEKYVLIQKGKKDFTLAIFN